MKNYILLFALFISMAVSSQSIYNPAQIGQTGRNQCTSRGFWVKSDTTLLTSQLWIPNGAGAGLVLTSNANGFATWQASSGWGLTGNAGTNTATNFLGTSDSIGFLIKTNGVTRTTINADGSRSDTYTGTNGRVLTNSFSGSAYLSSYGTGNFTYSGDLTFVGKGDSAKWDRWKSITLQSYSGGSIDIKSSNHLTESANNNIKRTAGNLIYDKSPNGVYVGNDDTIITATSYSSNVIMASDQCHIDSGAENTIIGSFQCAVRGVAANPFNNIAHNVIIGGYGDTTHCYHEIAIGAAAVGNRTPFSSGGWDVRDLYLSMGNYGGITLAIDSQQSNLIIIKNGNMAIGSALRAVDIPTPSDAMLHIYGSLQIEDGTQGAGKILTSDSNGLASWQGGIIYDSLTSLTGETVTLTNNSTYIIAASGTITDVTWSFPTGNTGDVLDIENMNVIVTLNITGVGTGTITAAKITNTKTAGLKTFHNYGGNWY